MMQGSGFLRPIVALVLALSSCNSILEDRSACPTRLIFDLVEDRGLDHRALLHFCIQNAAGRVITADAVSLGEVEAQYSLPIQKGRFYAWGSVGAGSERLEAGRYRIPEGQDCEPIYRFLTSGRALDETTRVPVWLNKEFCLLRLHFAAEDSGAAQPFYCSIESPWCGIDLSNGQVEKGHFHIEPTEEYPGSFVCRLPRQGGRGLRLHLYAKPDAEAFDTGEWEELDLWQLTSEVPGFSWDDESLKDLELQFDWARSFVQVRVNDWEIVHRINLTI